MLKKTIFFGICILLILIEQFSRMEVNILRVNGVNKFIEFSF